MEERIEDLERRVYELTSALIALRERLHEKEGHPDPRVGENVWASCYEGVCGPLGGL